MISRLSLFIMTSLAVAQLGVWAADEELPRNPFWPYGYEGNRYPITLEPRFKPQPKVENEPKKKVKRPTLKQQETAKEIAAREAREAARKAEEKRWVDARKSMVFGPTANFCVNGRTNATVTIDGFVYGVGDLVSRNFGDARFTWLVESISSNGKIKLKRLQQRPLTLRKNESK